MATVRIKWPANPPEELVSAYKVMGSFNDAPYIQLGTTPQAQFDVVNPAPGNWKFKVSASNFVGEGPESDPISGPGVPSKVGPLTLEIIV